MAAWTSFVDAFLDFSHGAAAMTGESLDDLPKYSPWPARLLGLEEWRTRSRTPADLEREFEREKWGSLLDRFSADETARLVDVDRWAAGTTESSLAAFGDRLTLMTPDESHRAYVDFVADAVRPYLSATALAEFGCGYGSVILALAGREEFAAIPKFAADYSSSGPELVSRLAKRESVDITTGRCDLTSSPITSLELPAGATIYTAYAATYVEPATAAFVTGLAALEPKVVVHIEPFYEHCDPHSTLGLLRQSYIVANGYSRNLLTILRDHESRGEIEILEERAPGFGPNPLLAASVIAWAPRKRS
ncbi:MAG: hypothetical protein ABIS03_01180 [Gemmatimonadaceae bacterium]